MSEHDMPLDPAALRAMWDFGDPMASAARFAEESRRLDPGSVRAAELTTQQARALGLAGHFADGHALLDGLQRADADVHPVVRARIALERGRLVNSAGQPVASVASFEAAVDAATEAGRDDLAADAFHMLAIADSAREADRYGRGVQLATTSTDPAARRWLGPLHNNHGWTLHDAGQYDDALDTFEAALAAYREGGDAESVRIAEWTVARCLRSLGRRADALAIQRRLKADGPPDPYVDEELALLQAE
ncbi:MAG: tetratricopeptide repeat protein [Thermomicrobiales bacterium]